MFVSLINKNNYQPISKGKSLVPRSEYKGVILKLTKADKQKIDILNKSKSELECELYKLENYMKNSKLSQQQSWHCFNKKMKLESFIGDVIDSIKQIKINRLNKQKDKLAKQKNN